MRSMLVVLCLGIVPAALVAQERQVVHVGAVAGLPFSPAIRTGNLVFLSGEIGNVPGTRNLVPGGVSAETRQAMENIRAVLEAAGSSMDRIVKCTVYLADLAEYQAMNAVYATYFTADPPARSAIQVAGLVFGARVEIECVAIAG